MLEGTADLRMRMGEMDRNDVAQAESLFEAYAERLGSVPGDVYHFCWKMQDDPARFERMVSERGFKLAASNAI